VKTAPSREGLYELRSPQAWWDQATPEQRAAAEKRDPDQVRKRIDVTKPLGALYARVTGLKPISKDSE